MHLVQNLKALFRHRAIEFHWFDPDFRGPRRVAYCILINLFEYLLLGRPTDCDKVLSNERQFDQVEHPGQRRRKLVSEENQLELWGRLALSSYSVRTSKKGLKIVG